MKHEDIYKVSDLGVGAALLAVGAKLLYLEPINERRVAFVFHYEQELPIHEKHFWSDELLINARSYFVAIKDLKSRLHSMS